MLDSDLLNAAHLFTLSTRFVDFFIQVTALISFVVFTFCTTNTQNEQLTRFTHIEFHLLELYLSCLEQYGKSSQTVHV